MKKTSKRRRTGPGTKGYVRPGPNAPPPLVREKAKSVTNGQLRYVVQCPLCGIPEVVAKPGDRCPDHPDVIRAIVGHQRG